MYAQLTPSSRKHRWLGSATAVAGLCAMALAGEAAADTYNFWLKSGPNAPYVQGTTKCAAGGFEFSKSGTTLESGQPVTNMTMSIAQSCVGPSLPAVNLAMTGTLSAVVRNIKLNGEPQGPNMDGLTGTLTSQIFTRGCAFGDVPANANNGTRLAQWAVTFSSTPGTSGAPGGRTYTLVETMGRCTNGTPNFNNPTSSTLLFNRPYHVVNTLHQTPEPETLLLLLGGLGLLALSRRKQGRG